MDDRGAAGKVEELERSGVASFRVLRDGIRIFQQAKGRGGTLWMKLATYSVDRGGEVARSGGGTGVWRRKRRQRISVVPHIMTSGGLRDIEICRNGTEPQQESLWWTNTHANQ